MKFFLLVANSFLCLLCSFTLLAQPVPVASTEEDLPKDYLTKDFHAGRREALRAVMPQNSVVVIFAYPTRTFSNDVEYLYHQNPDMYYFSGYREPHSVLFIFKENQLDSAGNPYNELLFVQERNANAEQWTGRRMGAEGAKQKLGLQMALNGKEFKNFQIDFSKFDKIIYDRFPVDIPNGFDKADLFDLIEQFKQKSNFPAQLSQQNRFDSRLFREMTAKLREIKTPE
jgi:Xaa-Pro aminopeptidase